MPVNPIVLGGIVSLVLTLPASGSEWTRRLMEARRLVAEEAYGEAIQAHEDAVKLATGANESSFTVAELRCELGWAMSAAGQSARALDEMSRAMHTLRGSAKPGSSRAACARHLAFHFRNAGNYKEAEALFAEAIEFEEKLSGRQSELARTVLGLAGLESLRGDFARAGQQAQRALTLQQAIADLPPLEMAETYATLALVSRGLRRSADALLYGERELKLRRTHSPAASRDILRALCLLASTNAELKRFSVADRWAKEAEAVLKNGGLVPTDRKQMLLTLAYVSSQRGDLRKAGRLFDEARGLLEAEAQPSSLELAMVWTHIGRIRRKLGEYDSAEQCHKTALSVLNGAVPETHPFLAFGWLDLADTYRLWRRYDAAIEHYRTGLEMAEKFTGKGSPTLATDYEMFASVLRKETPKARRRSISRWRRRRDRIVRMIESWVSPLTSAT